MLKSRVQRRRAFTLVELLVVIGIIALLISILIPALNKARNQANAVKCSSNMRQIYMMCAMFAQDHKGHLPTAGFDTNGGNPTLVDERVLWDQAGPGVANFDRGAIWPYLKGGKDAKMGVVYCPSDLGENVAYGALTAGSGVKRNFSYSINGYIMPAEDSRSFRAPGNQGAYIWGIPLASVPNSARKIMIYEEIAPNDTFCWMFDWFNYSTLKQVPRGDDMPSARHQGQRYANALRVQNATSPDFIRYQTAGKGNHVFFDGHVETLSPQFLFNNADLFHIKWVR